MKKILIDEEKIKNDWGSANDLLYKTISVYHYCLEEIEVVACIDREDVLQFGEEKVHELEEIYSSLKKFEEVITEWCHVYNYGY